jgi:hypothetical protein
MRLLPVFLGICTIVSAKRHIRLQYDTDAPTYGTPAVSAPNEETPAPTPEPDNVPVGDGVDIPTPEPMPEPVVEDNNILVTCIESCLAYANEPVSATPSNETSPTYGNSGSKRRYV